MFDRLDAIEKRYEQINKELQDQAIVSDIKKLTELSKEQKNLEKIVELYREYKKLVASVDDLKEMKKESDPEIAEMAAMELEENLARQKAIEDEIKILLLPKDPNDEKNVIVEIKGAAGGDEANIFAGDLFRMYSKYAESKGWKIEVMDAQPGAAGGYSNISFKVAGEAVYSNLKYESGTHRVQRIPTTEANGRIQTSTATVYVMPEAEEIDIKIDEKDLRIDTFCSSGPGGQGVNTTYSAVRVTHIPTGISFASQVYRSQHENKALAMKLLVSKLYAIQKEEQDAKDGNARRGAIGSGDRAEKIRTYNYPQNRVTDHRIGLTLQRLDAVMEGKLDLIIPEIINEVQKRKLAAETNNDNQ